MYVKLIIEKQVFEQIVIHIVINSLYKHNRFNSDMQMHQAQQQIQPRLIKKSEMKKTEEMKEPHIYKTIIIILC